MTDRSLSIKDGRVTSTLIIWGCTMVMVLGALIPLITVLDSHRTMSMLGWAALFFLPIFVLLVGLVGTGVVWLFGKPPTLTLGGEVKAIEDRLANLETIVSYEESDLKAKVQRLRSIGS